MGGGASTSKKYVLRTIDDTNVATPDSPAKARSRKQTAIYPADQDGLDSLDSKPKIASTGRRASAPVILTNEESGTGGSVPLLTKKASLARMQSKLPVDINASNKTGALDGKDTSSTATPLASSKGMLLQASSRNLLGTSSSSPQHGQLVPQQSMARMQRSNSVASRTATVCSLTYPWLLKQSNTAGTSLNDYELGRVIGRGLMGTVRIAKNKNGKYMVFKAVRKDYVVKHNDHRHIQNERDILRALNCSFCVRLFGTFQDRVNVYYVLEYCPGGELFQRLGRKKQFPPEEAKFYISEVFVALEHVQELGYVYRDLKPENIILDEEGHCKLVDFGFSTPCADNTTKLHTLCGTPAYLSPEQLDGKFTNGYTRVVDWWSFGVLIYELLTGKTPFSRNNKESHYEIFLRILNKRISFPWGMDSVSKDIISKLCHAQLDKRLCSAPEIKEHQYFTMPWEEVKNRRLVPPFVPRIKEEGDIHYFKSYAAPLVPKDSGGDDQGYGYFDF